jgi:uncharacterized membrane protein
MLEQSADWIIVAQQVPDMNGMYWLLVVLRVLHILGATIIVGGLIFLCGVVTPAVMPASANSADQQLGGRRAAWAMLVGIATLLLLASGLFNYIYTVKTYEMPASYHMLFGLKFLAGLVVFFLAALIAGRTSLALHIRQNIRLWLNVCLALSLMILILGSVMRTYERTPKTAQEIPPGIERP